MLMGEFMSMVDYIDGWLAILSIFYICESLAMFPHKRKGENIFLNKFNSVVQLIDSICLCQILLFQLKMSWDVKVYKLLLYILW